jgi:hypothetical protein
LPLTHQSQIVATTSLCELWSWGGNCCADKL